MLWTADKGPSGTASPALASSGIYIYDGEAIGVTSSQLEVYDLNYCNQYPGPATILTGFSDAFEPSWVAQQLVTGCGLGVQIDSSDSVTLETGN